MTEGDFTLVDARGRKYLTAEEREHFLAAVRAHRQPTVQTLARTLAMTGCQVSEALAVRACDVDLAAAEIRIACAQAPPRALARRTGAGGCCTRSRPTMRRGWGRADVRPFHPEV